MINLLILCRGNVTRSPFIAGYLDHLYKNSRLADKVELEIDSSGIEGKWNRPVHHRVLEKGLELGFDLSLYRSKHSDLKALEKADLIFVVDTHQYNRFKRIYSHLLPKTFHLHEFGQEENFDFLDFEDPSALNKEEDFQIFFKFAETEVIRVWDFLSNKLTGLYEQKQPIAASNFYKQDLAKESIEKRYGLITRRFHPVCPNCQSKRIRRIRREGFAQRNIWPQLNGFPYHCGQCNTDFILFIGAELKSTSRSAKKMRKWRSFMNEEKGGGRRDNMDAY